MLTFDATMNIGITKNIALNKSLGWPGVTVTVTVAVTCEREEGVNIANLASVCTVYEIARLSTRFHWCVQSVQS